MAKKTTLKHCPHCGGEARNYEGLTDFHGVVCKQCGAKVYGYSRKASATRAWNRRVEDITIKLQREEIDRLNEKIKYLYKEIERIAQMVPERSRKEKEI